MKHTPNETEAEALAPSPNEDPHLGHPLSASLDGFDDEGSEDDDDWDAELLRRVTEIRNGTAETFSAESVFAEAKRRFG